MHKALRRRWLDGIGGPTLGRRAGFTLIEMIVVVAILVILAGIVLPKLDRTLVKANKGVAGSNVGGVSRYIQTYLVMHNVYPDRWDSLLASSLPADASSGLAAATLPALVIPGEPAKEPGLDPALTGGPPAGSNAKLTTTTLVEDGVADVHEVRSLARMGITTLLDWGVPGGAPGDRFTDPRTLANGSPVATVNAADDDGAAIIDHIYPENKLPGGASGTVPAGKKLVVFGFGPLNTAVGDILQESPRDPETNPAQYYNRHLAVFEVNSGGGRAELKAVLGTDADRMDEYLNEFYER